MNLSKTEKLLAARKKLKEFQLNKKAHVQEKLPKQQLCSSEKAVLQGNYAKLEEQHVQENSNNFINDPVRTTRTFIRHNEKHSDVCIEPDNSVPNIIKDEINMLEQLPTSSNNERTNTELSENESCNIDNVFITNEAISQIPENDLEQSLHEYHSAVIENNEECTFTNVPMEESPGLQKEHLLQMASAVANVLEDNVQYNDTIDCDMKSLNEVLSSHLEEQKHIVNRLHIQVAQYSSRIAELEAILVTKDAEFEAKLIREITPLKEQLQIHAQTTGILIAEKAELNASLTQSQITAKRNAEEIEELSGKLKYSQQRISEIEKALTLAQSNNDDAERSAQQIRSSYDDLDQKYSDVRKEKDDLELELSELKQKLNLKNTELINMQQELEEKKVLLALNELKIQQLTNTSQEIELLEGQHHSVSMLEQQLLQMRDTLKSVSDEKDETSKQYQNYVRQLDMQHAKLLNELENEKKVMNDFEAKEQNYIARLSDMEQRLQHEKDRVQSLLPLQNEKNHVDTLNKNIDELMLEQERLHIMLTEKETDIKALTMEIQDLREANSQQVEASKLAVALEHEQLGASRAVSQNQQLKQQLSEMHDMFVLLSNTKLDLTEQLQAERTIGRKLNAHLDKMESEMQHQQDQLREKQAHIEALESEQLQNGQSTNQIHYQQQSEYAHNLEEELQKAKISIEDLKRQNAQLIEKLNLDASEEVIVTEGTAGLNGITHVETSYKQMNEKNLTTPDINIELSTKLNTFQLENNSLHTVESFQKLEERFKETMEKVAELTDEKQRLEHLVLQLQGETETIGEYITLYQKQRAILQEKAKEKDQAFRQLVEQCNFHQEHLHKLKILIPDLIKKKPDVTNSYSTTEHDGIFGDSAGLKPEKTNYAVAPSLIEDETTSQILDLLAEIKDCKDTCISEPNLHLCPWCSGKLITV